MDNQEQVVFPRPVPAQTAIRQSKYVGQEPEDYAYLTRLEVVTCTGVFVVYFPGEEAVNLGLELQRVGKLCRKGVADGAPPSGTPEVPHG